MIGQSGIEGHYVKVLKIDMRLPLMKQSMHHSSIHELIIRVHASIPQILDTHQKVLPKVLAGVGMALKMVS